MICNKCQIDKEVDQYATYFHSTQNKLRTRKVCNSCFKEQKSIYRESIKNKKIIDSTPIGISPTPIPQPTPTSTPNLLVNPEVFIDMDIDTKICFTCKVDKPVTEFYFHRKNNKPFTTCKQCDIDKEKKKYQEYIEENGGSDKVRRNPGEYVDKFQQEQVESFLKLIGWKYNGQHWYKEGLRGEDGIWEKMRGKKRYRSPFKNPKKSPVLDKLRLHTEEIVKLRGEGLTYTKIAYIYNASPLYVTKVITEYYEKNETN